MRVWSVEVVRGQFASCEEAVQLVLERRLKASAKLVLVVHQYHCQQATEVGTG